MQVIRYFNTNEELMNFVDENHIPAFSSCFNPSQGFALYYSKPDPIDTTKQEIGDELIKEIIQFISDKGFTVNFDYDENDLNDFSVEKDGNHIFAVEIY